MNDEVASIKPEGYKYLFNPNFGSFVKHDRNGYIASIAFTILFFAMISICAVIASPKNNMWYLLAMIIMYLVLSFGFLAALSKIVHSHPIAIRYL